MILEFNLGLSLGLDSVLSGRLGFGLVLVVSPDIGFYINQLLVQNYIAAAACTIAHLPFFNVVGITPEIVKHRICVAENNDEPIEILRNRQIGAGSGIRKHTKQE